MTKQEVKEFLIRLLNKEMEEEYGTTDKKDYIQDCIDAKAWVYSQFPAKGMDRIIQAMDLENDADKWMKD